MNTLILIGVGLAAAVESVAEYRRNGSSTVTSRVWARILIATGAFILAAATAGVLARSQETVLTIGGSCFMASGILRLVDLQPRRPKEF